MARRFFGAGHKGKTATFNSIKIKNICLSQNTIKKTTRQARMGKNSHSTQIYQMKTSKNIKKPYKSTKRQKEVQGLPKQS